jgi:hypothetical protein
MISSAAMHRRFSFVGGQASGDGGRDQSNQVD